MCDRLKLVLSYPRTLSIMSCAQTKARSHFSLVTIQYSLQVRSELDNSELVHFARSEFVRN